MAMASRWTVKVTRQLGPWWGGPGNTPASSPSSAWLILAYDVSDQYDFFDSLTGVPTQFLTFTPSGGAAIPAQELGSGYYYQAFPVAANMTTGTLTISGSFSATISNGSVVMSVASPVSIPITITAG